MSGVGAGGAVPADIQIRISVGGLCEVVSIAVDIARSESNKANLQELERKHKEALIQSQKFIYPRFNKIDPHYRYAGIKFTEIIQINGPIRSISIIPQQLVLCEENHYFIDIAVLLQQPTGDSNELKTLTKLAIECDGHEYHSKPEQIKRDNQRARQLMANGWKVIRFSGSEINNLNEYNFSQIEKELLSILFHSNR